MKVGDMVKIRNPGSYVGVFWGVGVILKIFEKKSWRTFELDPKINWDIMDHEQHAEVMTSKDVLNIPIAALRIVK